MFLTIKLYSYNTELFEVELIICVKMDLALNNQQKFLCHKTQTTPRSGSELYQLNTYLWVLSRGPI